MTTDPRTNPRTAPVAMHPTLAEAHAAAVEQGVVLPCTRRALLRRAGAGGAVVGAAGLLAACGGTGETTTGTDGGGAAETDSSAAEGGSGAGVAASEVPEGSAVVVEVGGEQVVLAQPSAGEYVAFSAVCTHAGGIVAADSGTEVKCPLHGSIFDAGDGGAVVEGPATSPLEEKTVALEGDQLVVS